MKTLFLNPPSYEGFDGGAGSRYQARREIRSFWYPTWLAQAAALVPGSVLIDAPPHDLTLEDVRERLKTEVDALRGEISTLMQAAVQAGSEVLADWAQGYCSDVRLIPTCVEIADYPPKADFDLGDPPRLVWLGSPATEHHLALMAPAVAAANRATGARLAVISSGERGLGPLTPFVDRLEWHPGVESTLAQFDVGLAPLADEPLARGKCAYKMLQYGAAGLPSVATPLGANGYVGAQLGVVPAEGDAQWTDAILGLLGLSAAERSAIGRHARERTAQLYSYDAWQDAWLAAVGATG